MGFIPGEAFDIRREVDELNFKRVLRISFPSLFIGLLALPVFPDSPDEILSPMLERLNKGGRSAYSYVLRQYNRVESGKRLDVFERYEVHQKLLKALRARTDKDLLAVVQGLVKK